MDEPGVRLAKMVMDHYNKAADDEYKTNEEFLESQNAILKLAEDIINGIAF